MNENRNCSLNSSLQNIDRFTEENKANPILLKYVLLMILLKIVFDNCHEKCNFRLILISFYFLIFFVFFFVFVVKILLLKLFQKLLLFFAEITLRKDLFEI